MYLKTVVCAILKLSILNSILYLADPKIINTCARSIYLAMCYKRSSCFITTVYLSHSRPALSGLLARCLNYAHEKLGRDSRFVHLNQIFYVYFPRGIFFELFCTAAVN